MSYPLTFGIVSFIDIAIQLDIITINIIKIMISWTVRMMCNLDSESVAIERIREYDNLPQVDLVIINIVIINIVIIMVNTLIIAMVVSIVICRKLLGRHRQSLALHWTGQTGARFSSSTSLPPS